ncbi:unnamed protein product [Amoebophrya sp. A25]|nr:unnamed protein product [Amoebophrya sp. A25]|eukprot:GSA25T00022289001.1
MTESDGKGDFGGRTLYCGNLAWKVGWQDLKDFFGDKMEVEHAEVLTYKDGKKTGSGVVRFKRPEDAEKAMKEFQDKPLKGREVFLRPDAKGGKGPGSARKGQGKYLSEEAAACQLFVGNLSFSTSWQNLKDFMGDVGDVEYCDILTDKDGRSAGSGLVRFKDPEDAKKAIAELQDELLDGRKIFVREDRDGRRIEGKSSKGKGKGKDAKGKGKTSKGSKASREDEVAMYVPGLGSGTSWKDVKDAFSEFKPVHTETKMMGGSLCGIVKFSDDKMAEKAYEGMWHVECLGVKKIEPTWDKPE